METGTDPLAADHEAYERELTMVRGAIRMVTGGAYRSMILGGLAHGGALLDQLRRDAADAGVELVPLARADGGLDIRVRALGGLQPRVVR